MNKKNLNLIKEIINSDIDNKQIADLLSIKNYIDDQISNISYQDNYDVLSLDLIEFMYKYLIIEKERFNRYSVYCAVSRIKNKTELKVYDVVGIGSEELLEYKNIGEYTVDKLENTLSIFGYSLDTPLTDYEQEKLKVYIKENKDAN